MSHSKHKLASLALAYVFFLFLGASGLVSANEGMPNMPMPKGEKTFTVTDSEALSSSSGFGKEAPMAKMMSLMMVEGSGMEGMDMSMPMGANPVVKGVVSMPSAASEKAAPGSDSYDMHAEITPNPPRPGINKLAISLKDHATGKPVTKLRLKATSQMTEMNMGVDEKELRETAPGLYEVDVPFSMAGKWSVAVKNFAAEKDNTHEIALLFTFHPGDPGKWKQP